MKEPHCKIPRGRRSHRLWQELVDSAFALLIIDSCRQYGLITGGPECNSERCREILEQGQARGFRPRAYSIRQFLDMLEEEKAVDSEGGSL